MRRVHSNYLKKERSEIVVEMAESLLAGRHCMLLGRVMTGKTPVVRDLVTVLQENAPRAVLVCYADLQVTKYTTWRQVGEALSTQWFRGTTSEVLKDWHISDLIAKTSNSPAVHFILLIDHVDALSDALVYRLAQECSGLTSAMRANVGIPPVSLFLSGREDRLVTSISRVNSFPRIADVWQLNAYNDVDFDRLMERYANEFRLPELQMSQQSLFNLSGGHPSLARRYGDSLLEAVIQGLQGRLFKTRQVVLETVEEVANEYVQKLLEAIGNRPSSQTDVSTRLINQVIDRVESDATLLQFVFCLRLSKSSSLPECEFVGLHKENGDILNSSNERLYIRSSVLQRTLLAYFTFERLAYQFFCIDRTRESWGKAVLCCAIRRQRAEVESANSYQLSAQFIESLSCRLHTQHDPGAVLDLLVLTLKHFFPVDAVLALAIGGGNIRPTTSATNSVLPDFIEKSKLEAATKTAPPLIQRALRTGLACSDVESRVAAIPISVYGNIEYLIWIEGDVEAFLHDIRTLVRISEGPLAASVSESLQATLVREFFNSDPEDRVQIVDAREKRIELLSPASCRDVGESPQTVIGQRCEELFRCQPDAGQCICDWVINEQRHFRGYQKWRTPSGDENARDVWVDVHAWPLLDRGRVVKVCQSARDITPSFQALQSTEELLNANSEAEVYDILMACAEQMGFRRGRLFLSEAHRKRMAGILRSSRCFGHGHGGWVERFRKGGFTLDAEKEQFWYEKRNRRSGVFVITKGYSDRAIDKPKTMTIPYVMAPASNQPTPWDDRTVRVQAALEVKGRCYGFVVADMGPATNRISEHLCHRFFGVVRVASQTLLMLEYREKQMAMLTGFRHSLAKPVHAIQAAAAAISEGHADAAISSSTIVQTQARDLCQLYDNLLASVHNRTNFSADLAIVDISGVVSEMVEDYQAVVADTKTVIRYSPPQGALVETNIEIFKAILRNLLENGIKAAQANVENASPLVELILDTAGDYAKRIRVFDSGVGVDPSDVASVFEKGFSRFGSTGIGLPASRFYASLFGAQVEFNNRKDQLRTFVEVNFSAENENE